MCVGAVVCERAMSVGVFQRRRFGCRVRWDCRGKSLIKGVPCPHTPAPNQHNTLAPNQHNNQHKKQTNTRNEPTQETASQVRATSSAENSMSTSSIKTPRMAVDSATAADTSPVSLVSSHAEVDCNGRAINFKGLGGCLSEFG